MPDEITLKLMFAESGNVELRQIPFNHSGIQVYYNLNSEGQELVIAGIPSEGTQEELIQVFEYLVGIAKDSVVTEIFEEGQENS